ncbi:MAG: hypothetical protein NUV67_04080 [archaeon]|nr:hypothetical protein [archaeon]
MKPMQTFYVATGILAVFGSVLLLGFFNAYQVDIGTKNLFAQNPIGVFGIVAILVFSGVYFFNTAAKVIKEAIK